VNAVEPVAIPAKEGTTVEGTILRILAPSNQIVVRTTTGQEVTLAAGPKTAYRFGTRDVQFSDFRQGQQVNVSYDVRGGQPIMSSLVGRVVEPK